MPAGGHVTALELCSILESYAKLAQKDAPLKSPWFLNPPPPPVRPPTSSPQPLPPCTNAGQSGTNKAGGFAPFRPTTCRSSPRAGRPPIALKSPTYTTPQHAQCVPFGRPALVFYDRTA